MLLLFSRVPLCTDRVNKNGVILILCCSLLCALDKPNALAGLRAVSWRAGSSPWGHLVQLRYGGGFDLIRQRSPRSVCLRKARAPRSVLFAAAERVMCLLWAGTALQNC